MIENSNEMFIMEAGKYINSIPDLDIRDNIINERPNFDFTSMRYKWRKLYLKSLLNIEHFYKSKYLIKVKKYYLQEVLHRL